jgi:hypothetical protein
MIVYLVVSHSVLHCNALAGMPVLFSYAHYSPIMEGYQASFSRILIDSGAFSEHNTGKKIEGEAYREWASQWEGHADAIAGLDDISGDVKRSFRNYEKFGGFPTIHFKDPFESLPDLLEVSRKQGKRWLGIGGLIGKGNRDAKEDFVRRVCDSVPSDTHLHAWGAQGYTHIRRVDSIDHSGWLHDSMRIRKELPFLTYGEADGLAVKRAERWKRVLKGKSKKGLLS